MGNDQQVADRSNRTIQDGVLELRVRQDPGSWVIEAHGELDFANAGTLESELEQRDGKPVVLDLRPLEFLDTAGISLLWRAARRPESQIEVHCGSGQPSRVLRLCGVDQRIWQLRE